MKPESVQTLMPAKRNREPRTGMPSALDKDTVVIPLSSEDVVVERRDVKTGVVSVSTATTNHQHVIGEGPTCERVEIERAPLEIYVDLFPEIRTEGDTMILPVVEEVMVRRLLLREEARIRTIKTTERHQ